MLNLVNTQVIPGRSIVPVAEHNMPLPEMIKPGMIIGQQHPWSWVTEVQLIVSVKDSTVRTKSVRIRARDRVYDIRHVGDTRRDLFLSNALAYGDSVHYRDRCPYVLIPPGSIECLFGQNDEARRIKLMQVHYFNDWNGRLSYAHIVDMGGNTNGFAPICNSKISSTSHLIIGGADRPVCKRCEKRAESYI